MCEAMVGVALLSGSYIYAGDDCNTVSCNDGVSLDLYSIISEYYEDNFKKLAGKIKDA
jgi:hypothetical protein